MTDVANIRQIIWAELTASLQDLFSHDLSLREWLEGHMKKNAPSDRAVAQQLFALLFPPPVVSEKDPPPPVTQVLAKLVAYHLAIAAGTEHLGTALANRIVNDPDALGRLAQAVADKLGAKTAALQVIPESLPLSQEHSAA